MAMDLKSFGLPSRGVMEEDDGVVELSLGLSIGGISRRAPGPGPALQRRDPGTGSGEGAPDRGGSGSFVPSSPSPPPPSRAVQQGHLDDGLHPRRRREMHALRRQEARKKRHEKQQKRGSTCGGRDGAVPGFYGFSLAPEGTCSRDDRVALEAQEQRCRVRDREAREVEARQSDRRAGESHEPGSAFVPNPEICPSANANPNAGPTSNPSNSPNYSYTNLPPFAAHPFPVMAMQYPYPHVQFVPMANGFGFPYMMPCWAPAMSSVAGGPNPATNVFQPVAGRTFHQPFSPRATEPTNGASPLSNQVADLSEGNSTGIKRAPSTGSLISNSSLAISDYQSNSLQAGSSSSDIRSHSSRVLPAESSYPQLSPQASNLVHGQSEQSISSRQIEPEVDAVEAPSEKIPPSNSPQSGATRYPNPTQCPPVNLEGMVSVNKPVPAAAKSTPPPPPPLSPPLPWMPCVSTTGNGPNGRTITGFLYRYTSTEVSIVCVCHGSSFSPAEFVKHAGGTDIANPLRHIIVVPS